MHKRTARCVRQRREFGLTLACSTVTDSAVATTRSLPQRRHRRSSTHMHAVKARPRMSSVSLAAHSSACTHVGTAGHATAPKAFWKLLRGPTRPLRAHRRTRCPPQGFPGSAKSAALAQVQGTRRTSVLTAAALRACACMLRVGPTAPAEIGRSCRWVRMHAYVRGAHLHQLLAQAPRRPHAQRRRTQRGRAV
jgi:hypothetical protein